MLGVEAGDGLELVANPQQVSLDGDLVGAARRHVALAEVLGSGVGVFGGPLQLLGRDLETNDDGVARIHASSRRGAS